MLSLRRRRPEYSDYSSNLNTQVNYLHKEIYMTSIHLYNRKAKINFSKMSLYILYCIYTRLFQLWTYSLCVHCKTKTNKNFADYIKKISWIIKIFKHRILMDANFWKFDHPETFPGVTRDRQTYKVYI